MNEFFIAHIFIYTIFLFYLARLDNPLRTVGFYVYISLVLFVGGFFGSVYSIPITESIKISGGSLAYGALMTASILFVIIEKNLLILRNIVRLVITVNIFKILIFSLLSWGLSQAWIINPIDTSASLFKVSIFFVALGGILIVLELLALLYIFEQLKSRITNVNLLFAAYLTVFISILCLDGILFPTIAFGFDARLVAIIIGGVKGKLIISTAYAIPMAAFMYIHRAKLLEYSTQPAFPWKLLFYSQSRLMDEINKRETLIQQKTREAELKESELFTTFQALPDLFFRMDSDGVILNYHAQKKSDLYISPDNFLGKPMQAILPPSIGQLYTESLAQINTTGELITFQYNMEMYNSDHRYEARLMKLDNSKDIIAVIRDVTESYKMLRALEESEERFRDLYERTPVMMLAFDAQGHILEVSEHWLEKFSYKRDEVIGSSITDYQTSSSAKITEEKIIAGFHSTTKTDFIELEFVTKQGDRLDIEFSGILQPDQKQSIKKYLAVLIDVTEKKQAMNEVISQLNELRRWQNVTIGRENKVIELKQEVNALLGEQGHPGRYSSVEKE